MHMAEALSMLDDEYNKIWTRVNGIQRDIQLAYYKGLKDMYEGIIDMKVTIDHDGKHRIDSIATCKMYKERNDSLGVRY